MTDWLVESRKARLALRRAGKQAVANCLDRTKARAGLAALGRRSAGGTRVLIVAYHRVVPNFEEMRERVIPALLTSSSTFERQLATLAESYRIAPLSEALTVLDGSSSTDRDLCVVTFDDGYRDFLEHALPVLNRMGVPSTLYVPTGFVGGAVPLLHDRLYWVLRAVKTSELRPTDFRASGDVGSALEDALRGHSVPAVNRLLERWNRSVCLEVAQVVERSLGLDPAAATADSTPLSWDELRAVRAAGVQIGGHTADHACLHVESPTEIVRQVHESKARIERELGSSVVDFAYPNGWYSQRAIAALQAAGYRSAVTTEDRINRVGEHPFALKRKIVWEFTSRGVRRHSDAVAACNFDGVFVTAGLSFRVGGEKSDAQRWTSSSTDS